MKRRIKEANLKQQLKWANIKRYEKRVKLQLPEPSRRLKRNEDYLRWNEPMAFDKSITLIVLLIAWGGDIYAIRSHHFDNLQHWSDLITHCTQARLTDAFDEFRLALYWSELDPDQVFLEDERQRKPAFKLYGATRSGIDETVLALPSVDGLRCRLCRRQYCNNHYFSQSKKTESPLKWYEYR